MKMPGDQRRLDVRPTEFAPNQPRCRAFPDRVLNVYDRSHQCNETQVTLNHRDQRTDPSAVTGRQHAEFAAAASAQHFHQLTHFHYALAQPLRVADQVAGNRKFAIPITVRDTRIMVWQLNKACVPAKFVEMVCATSIADRARGPQRMQNENRWRAPSMF